MLYIIGLGLFDERDITVRGLEAVKRCDHVHLEHYTAILMVEKEKLEEFYGKPVEIADRETVEQGCDTILEQARTGDCAFLVVGDPFGATTHTDLILRAKELGIKVQVIHNASIMNACGACGLQLYRFGETVSIPWFQGSWRPDSWYERIKHNRSAGLHTLCLLDIKVKEPNIDQLARGRTVYEPPRYMSIAEAIEQLLEVELLRGEGVYNEGTMAVGLARIGCEDQIIAAGSMTQVAAHDMGKPLHAMIICGETHELETMFLQTYEVVPGAVVTEPMPNMGSQAPAAPVVDSEANEVEQEEEAPPAVNATKREPVTATGAREDSESDGEFEMADPAALLEMDDALS